MDSPSSIRFTPLRIALALPLVVLLLVAVFVPPPLSIRGPGLLAVLNFAHFSFAAVACWFLTRRMEWPGWVAFGTVVAAAAMCEIVQGYTGRCPAMSDFLRGLFGASVGLVGPWLLRPSVPAARWITGAVAIAAVSAWPVSELLFAAASLCLRAT